MTETLPVLVNGISKTFGDVRAVIDVSLEVRRGEIVGLLGPNGAGKTTTIESVCGLIPIDGGSVHVFGHDATTTTRAAQQHIGLGTQQTAVLPLLTARENVVLFARLRRLSDPNASALELAGQLRLEPLLSRKCADLSGGQQRRVQLAMATVGRPPVIILEGGAPPRPASILQPRRSFPACPDSGPRTPGRFHQPRRQLHPPSWPLT